MGRGPEHLLNGGAVERLEALGHQVTVAAVDPGPGLPAEIATGFAVMAAVAGRVDEAVADGAFPLVLAGNCSTATGTVSGLAPRRAGVVWLDAHADFNTPETSVSGFLDGMALAILTGHCWQPLAHGINGYAPVADQNVVLAGFRDVDPVERDRLSASPIACLTDQDINGSAMEQELVAALDRIATRVDGLYLHIDLDVHDPSIAPANQFRPPGGVTPARLRHVVEVIAGRMPILAAFLGAYDPDADPNGVTLASALDLMEAIAGGVAGRGTR